jgi:hypothetical protein
LRPLRLPASVLPFPHLVRRSPGWRFCFNVTVRGPPRSALEEVTLGCTTFVWINSNPNLEISIRDQRRPVCIESGAVSGAPSGGISRKVRDYLLLQVAESGSFPRPVCKLLLKKTPGKRDSVQCILRPPRLFSADLPLNPRFLA